VVYDLLDRSADEKWRERARLARHDAEEVADSIGHESDPLGSEG